MKTLAIAFATFLSFATLAHATGEAVADIAIQVVTPGRESLELCARLSENDNVIERPIAWSVTAADGEPVFTDETAVASLKLGPGDYQVALRYGAVQTAQTVTLVEGTRLMVSFVLDAGGIRVMPNVPEIGLPATPPRNRVFALSGKNRGKLVATSAQPGEVMNLPKGTYRIESSFENGNVSATTDVVVKPGRLSAVAFDHAAGIARLAYLGNARSGVVWRLTDAKGNVLDDINGLAADVVLTSGNYVATAQAGGELLTAKFAIAAGQSRDIILGN